MTSVPFPDTVPTAPLLRISLARLLNHDREEEERFWSACCDLGFFYLDLRSPEQTNGHTNGHTHGVNGHANGSNGSNGSNGHPNGARSRVEGEGLLDDANELFKVAEEFFDLPVEEKIKYDFSEQRSYFGYKGYGQAIIDQKGSPDRNEFYNVSKDDILEVAPRLPAPALLEKHRPLLKSYITRSHALISFVLQLLEPHLQLASKALQDLHRVNAVSGDQVRFVKAPPQPPEDRRTALGAHTDFGSVTVLFNRIGGLQVRLPENVKAIPPKVEGQMSEAEKELCKEGWAYVHPLPGHAIINLGDAMVKFSAGILRSNTHRVVAPPGAQGDVTRYSLVYFSRPEDEVMLRPLRESKIIDDAAGVVKDEEVISSKEWILRRALGKRTGKFFNPEHSKGTEDARGARG